MKHDIVNVVYAFFCLAGIVAGNVLARSLASGESWQRFALYSALFSVMGFAIVISLLYFVGSPLYDRWDEWWRKRNNPLSTRKDAS